ncbi:hypothetical protein ES702_01183 [subsurface metagenome]
MDDKSLLNDFLKGLKKGVSGVEMGVLRPWGPFQLEPYFLDLWAKKLIEAVDKIQAKKIKFSEVAKNFPSNAVIRDVFGYFVIGMKILKIPKKDRANYALFLLKVLQERSKSKDFTFLKENLVLSKNKVTKLIKNKKWQKPTEVQRTNIGILAASLRNLIWSLYTDIFVNTGFEISGPHNLGKGSQLVIRNFFNLKPVEIWSETKKFPYKKIKIYTLYQNAGIKIIMFNRVFSKKSLKETLEKFALEGISSLDLEKINSKVMSYTAEQEKRFDKLDFEAKKDLYIKIKHYALKDFFKLAGMDWQPDKAFYQRVKGKELIPSKDLKLKPDQVAEIYVRIFDPMDDFLPDL